MGSLALAIGSLLIGVLATIWVSRYYFRRTISKSLTPYVQFFSSLFDGVDQAVRESLKIAYKGTAVTELLEIQFLIANTGERSIRDVIAPLSLSIPNGCKLLDASILHVSPEGREVKITQAETWVSFEFPLLNAGEFFITKLLLQGRASPTDFTFKITVDDLPPTISPVSMPPDLVETGKKREFEAVMFWVGVILTLLAASIAGLIFAHWPSLRACWTQGIIASFRHNWVLLVSTVIAVIPSILLFVLGPMLIFGAFTNFSFPKRRRFRVPETFLPQRFYVQDWLSRELNVREEKKV